MLISIRMILVLFLAASQTVAVAQSKEQEEELPLAAKTALQEMERTIQIAKKKAVEKLRSAMKAEMQAGKLERANKINQEIQKIDDVTDSPSSNDPQSVVIGEWLRKDGVMYVLNKKQEVRVLQNGWSGTWKIENTKLIITLNMLHGKPANKLEYSYAMPLKKEINNKATYLLQCNAEDMTLYKK